MNSSQRQRRLLCVIMMIFIDATTQVSNATTPASNVTTPAPPETDMGSIVVDVGSPATDGDLPAVDLDTTAIGLEPFAADTDNSTEVVTLATTTPAPTLAPTPAPTTTSTPAPTPATTPATTPAPTAPASTTPAPTTPPPTTPAPTTTSTTKAPAPTTTTTTTEAEVLGDRKHYTKKIGKLCPPMAPGANTCVCIIGKTSSKCSDDAMDNFTKCMAQAVPFQMWWHHLSIDNDNSYLHGLDISITKHWGCRLQQAEEKEPCPDSVKVQMSKCNAERKDRMGRCGESPKLEHLVDMLCSKAKIRLVLYKNDKIRKEKNRR